MKDWEVIADNLSKSGWSWGCVSAIDSQGERYGLSTPTVVTEGASSCNADEKLSAFLELEKVTREIAPRESPAIS